MGLDVWFKSDVQRILASLRQAASRYSGDYQQGYRDALADVGLAFGLDVQDNKRPAAVEALAWQVNEGR